MTGWLLALPAVLALAAGPAPAPTTYPDGLVVRIGSLERLPADRGATCDAVGVCTAGEAAGDVLVRVNVVLGLPASAPAPIALDVVAGTAGGISLLAGPGRLPAAIDCGFIGETDVLCTDSANVVPTRVDPGTDVTVSEAFDVPAGALNALTVRVQPPVSDATGANPLRATTFDNAEALLPR